MTSSPASAAVSEMVATVVVVDDDPIQLRAITRIIERMGLRPIASPKPFGVLNLIATSRPVLVVLDVMMPGLDGPTLARLIRADVELARTRVVLRSAVDEDELRRIAAACGADGYIPKTMGPGATGRRLQQWLEE